MADEGVTLSTDVRQLALEVFTSALGAQLVGTAARLLTNRGIPVMPLKGVLLQKWVYKDQSFRPISDVDIAVPASEFMRAYAILKSAGFSRTRWEDGNWQVTLHQPEGSHLGIDLHRSLSRTPRSGLTTAGMFERGSRNTAFFGAEVVLPSPNDLFAHLLQHATLHWINQEQLHHPEDFEIVATALKLDPRACASHLREQGLAAHALLMLPILGSHTGPFLYQVAQELKPDLRSLAAAQLARRIFFRWQLNHPIRRMTGLILAPSIARAAVDGLRERLVRNVDPGA